jgi:PqqD family protein of HPr-rel-A system
MKWRRESSGRFYDANESSVVYFDSHSGDTHLLSDFAAHVVQQFGDQPLSTEQLIDKIMPTIDAGDADQLTDALPAVLEELVTLDILKRA